jgi:flavin reductase (DIM6/NTAB) family NADH-FMN oxidoreductase RutF
MDKIKITDGCFFTQQVFLVGTYDENDTAHFAPFSWISYTCGRPACLIISIRGDKNTKHNIARTNLLSATVLTPDLIPFAECCNRATMNPALCEKVRPAFVKGSVLDVPLIEKAVWSYECRVINTVQIGETHTYFAEIAEINVAPEIQKLDFIDLREINPVIYAHFNYFSIGGHLGKIGDFSKQTT